MSILLTDSRSELDRVRAHCFATLTEVFGAAIVANRPLCRAVVRLLTGYSVETMRDFTADQYRETARNALRLLECPDQAQEIVREAAATLSPNAQQLADAGALVDLSTQNIDTRDHAVSFLERIGEAGLAGRWAAGDCANVLLLLHPDARPADVLGEFLRAPEMEKLKGFLCPKLPWSTSLSDEERLRYEETALNTLAELARVAARVPQRLRDLHPQLSFEWFRVSATAQEFRDGRFYTPTESEIARRLDVASDEKHRFRSLSAFRLWCRTGAVESAPKADAPDVTADALAAFRSAFHAADSVAAAWSAVFSTGEYAVSRRRVRK